MTTLSIKPSGPEMSPTSIFSMTRRGNALVVCPGGPRVGEREAGVISPQVRTAIRDCGASFKGLILDLSQVKVMSSYGLGLCIELRNLAHSLNAGTVLYGASSDIRELFRVMKVDRLFTVALTPSQVPKQDVEEK